MSNSSSNKAAPTSQPNRKRRKWLRLFVVGLIVVSIFFCGLMAIPIVSPAAGAAIADGLRSIMGPEAVAEIESFQFRLQDTFNRARYQVSGGQAQITWADSSNTTPAAPKSITVKPTANKVSSPTKTVPNQPTKPAPSQVIVPTVNQAAPVVQADPPVDVISAPSPVGGWQPFGTLINNQPVMARTVVNPDPSRPYAQAAVVRIDLSQVDLHAVAGTVEPVAVKGAPALKRTGIITPGDQNPDSLLAAFNGGFKAVHGGYGMMVDGVTLRPPMDHMATLALFKDGSVQIGAWGRDFTSADNMVSFRQNCPLLIDSGEINPHVTDENRKEWGYTVKNLDTTWRSGLGLSQDGRFLIYAAGNSLTVQSLAEALLQAGAYNAMQMDINGFYTRFVTYQDNPKVPGYPVIASKLLNEMSGDPALFLHPYDRDFFYVTVKS
jgi:hypothetical protein